MKATTLLDETFANASAADWTFIASQGVGPQLTAPSIDAVGAGWLRLTPDSENQSSFAYYNNTLPTAGGLVFSFDFAIWTTGPRAAADGITLAIFAPDTGGAWVPSPGGYGGSLGYAQRLGINGLDRAIVGVGFDPFGNFSAPTEGRNGGPGRRSNSVAIRGPMEGDRRTGYEYIMGTGSLDEFYTRDVASRDLVTLHSAKISISPDKTFSVAWTDKDGNWEKLILEDCELPCPENVMFGFTGGTGASSANQEVRNLVVTDFSASSFVWDGGSSVNAGWGETFNWLLDGLPVFGSTADLVFTSTGATRLSNYLGEDRTIRSLEFDPATAGDIILRTTTTATGTNAANLTFDATGDGASIFVREDHSGKITIGEAGGGILLESNLLVAHHGTGELTMGRPVGGTAGFTKSGSGTLVLSATNTFSGATTLLKGTIRTDANNALGASGGSLEVWDGILDLNGTNQTKLNTIQRGGVVQNGTLTLGSRYHFYAGSLSGVTLAGGGGLDKWDSTTLTLATASTYSGGTVVRGGKLIVSNPNGSGTGSGSMEIRAGTTLAGSHAGGSGVIAGATTIAGTHAVGNGSAGSVGIQNFSSTLSYSNGSVFEWDLNTTAGTYDQVLSSGALNVESGAVFKIASSSGFDGPFWTQNRTWSDIFGGKDISGFNASNFQFVGNGTTWTASQLAPYGSFSISGSSLQWNPVPEPGNLSVGALLIAALMRRRRQRRDRGSPVSGLLH